MGKPYPGPWTFNHHPWLREIHDADCEEVVGRKAAQMGFTECAINKTFYAIDVKGESVLYLLPASKPDAHDFSTSRFDPALELSPHLSNLFSDTKNIGHKRAGTANLFIRGSKSRAQVKSIPVARIIADEVDEMDQDNLILAFERSSGQVDKERFMLSTPTISGFGIDVYYQRSSQESYFFRCPHCSKLTVLVFPDCLVITSDDATSSTIRDSYLICRECKHILDHNQKPEWLSTDNCEWVPAYEGRLSRGFHVSQLYSMTTAPWELAYSYLRAQSNPADEQELHNSKLGEPHEVEGARVQDKHIDLCRADYLMGSKLRGDMITTMGVDVGKFLHVEITQWTFNGNYQTRDINLMARARLILATKVEHFENLDELIRRYGVMFTVVDNQPETRQATEFAKRWHGRVRLCRYNSNLGGNQLKDDEDIFRVDANRTAWLDLSLGRFKSTTISLPHDLPLEYIEHVKALVRIYEKDRDGNPVGRYVKPEHTPDHFAHARNYSEIALLLGASLMRSESINHLW